MTIEQNAAHARLITAAPELLAEGKENEQFIAAVVRALSYLNKVDLADMAFTDMLLDAENRLVETRAVIAKAEGK